MADEWAVRGKKGPAISGATQTGLAVVESPVMTDTDTKGRTHRYRSQADDTGETLLSNRWNRVRYRLWAPLYDAVARPLEGGRQRAIEGLDLQPGDRVLLLGSGTGADLEYFPPDVSVTAIDLTPAMVRRTEARAETLPIGLDARVGDAQSLSVPDDSFDAVVLHLILTVVSDPDAVLAEAERVLDPDGRVSIFDKFVPSGTSPSLARRALNPVARLLFSDLTRGLDLGGTGLTIESRASALGGLYTVAVAQPS